MEIRHALAFFAGLGLLCVVVAAQNVKQRPEPPAGALAELVGLEITTDTQPVNGDGWAGFACYDILEFRAVPKWNDGKPDPGCTRAGAPPRWKTNYGWFEPPKSGVERMMMAVADPPDRKTEITGAKVLWSTGFREDTT
ncbi:MAG: hypothetical protein NTU53_11705 [Planctomycetota bacterium]|nr:hypothetical protein [Planctomycetota bacterium]